MKAFALGLCTVLLGLWGPSTASVLLWSTDSVEAGRESLTSRGNLPWYDAEEDALRRIEVQPNEDDAKRHSEWARTQGQPSTQTRWSGEFLLTLLRILAWIGIGLLVALIIWALLWAMRRAERFSDSTAAEATSIELAASRIEDLPMPVQPQHADLLAAAQAYVEAGDLRNAIIYAFAHQLVELDKHHLIQLTKGKTNREYLRELRAHPSFIPLLSSLMLAFEEVYFGNHDITRQRFDQCWQDLDRFHHQLEQVAL
jgi:hypothetical protein